MYSQFIYILHNETHFISFPAYLCTRNNSFLVLTIESCFTLYTCRISRASVLVYVPSFIHFVPQTGTGTSFPRRFPSIRFLLLSWTIFRRDQERFSTHWFEGLFPARISKDSLLEFLDIRPGLFRSRCCHIVWSSFFMLFCALARYKRPRLDGRRREKNVPRFV